MRVLIVCSGNSGQISPFVSEQVESVRKLGVEFDYYNIIGKGILGYLKNIQPLKYKIISYNPDIIHAHYGLSGMLSIIVKGSHPLITTFHGNDINTLHPLKKLRINLNKYISRIAYSFSTISIFVSAEIAKQIEAKPVKSTIIPCEVNLDIFYPVDKVLARKQMKLSPSKNLVLFSSSFGTHIKNYPLAKEACSQLKDIELIELKGFTRREVNLLLNACNLALITSFNEGSSQFLKESMACNRPVVSTNVGDSQRLLANQEGCFLTSFEPANVTEKIKLALKFERDYGQTNGRKRIIELGLDSKTIARKIFQVYNQVLTKE
jgi:teichuronic acid biosynthesis glycosyltransferase TuaC